MSSELKSMQGNHDAKWSNMALVFCAIEVAILLGAILFDLAFSQHPMLVSRFSALSWLFFGGASIVVSIVGVTKGQKRSSSISVAVVCVVIFVLCAFRFALV